MDIDFGNPYTLDSSKTSGFIKRKYHMGWLTKDALTVFTRVSDIYAIAMKNRLPEEFREEIMVVVSRANGCTICNFTHHDFAQVAGVDFARLRKLEKADFSDTDPKRKVAFDFAIAKSLNDFGEIDPLLHKNFSELYSPQEQLDIEFVSRFITIMNLCCNKLEAFSVRTAGGKVADSSLVSEVIISGIAMTIIPVMYGLVALARGESFYSVCKDFFEFAKHYEEAVTPILCASELSLER